MARTTPILFYFKINEEETAIMGYEHN